MIRQYLALLLIGCLLGMCAPAFAGEGDFVATTFVAPQKKTVLVAGLGNMYSTSGLPNFTTRVERPRFAAFDLPQSGQQQPGQSPASQPTAKQLTTAGKVMKWVGIGLMGEGALTMGLGAAEGSSASGACGAGAYQVSCGTVRGVYYGIGGVSIGVGAILLVVGLHKKE